MEKQIFQVFYTIFAVESKVCKLIRNTLINNYKEKVEFMNYYGCNKRNNRNI